MNDHTFQQVVSEYFLTNFILLASQEKMVNLEMQGRELEQILKV